MTDLREASLQAAGALDTGCRLGAGGQGVLCDAMSALPQKAAVVQIVTGLRHLLFPCLYPRLSAVSDRPENTLAELAEKLSAQIALALAQQDGRPAAQLQPQADERTAAFLAQLPQIRDTILTDVQATFDGDPAAESQAQILLCYPGIFAISIYRLAHQLYTLQVPLIPRIMTEYAHQKTGIDIHAGAQIGPYFCIDHGTGIVIGETCQIGTGVKLYQGVTLGALSTRGGQSLRGKKRHPTVQDGVTIYCGCTILGGDTVIGQNAVIGGNAFITRSIPSDAKVRIQPPQLHIQSPDDSQEWRI